jgi:predicted phosphodiesterase
LPTGLSASKEVRQGPLQTSMRTIAVIADVHSNSLALEAVLTDIARHGVDLVVNLGDNVNGPLEPQRCADLLRTRCQVHVWGTGDRMTLAGGPSASAKFASEQIDADTREWLATLPLTVTGDGWLACHGSPTDDEFYLLEAVAATGVTVRCDAAIAAVLGPVQQRVIFCGHTHVPRVVRLADGRTVVNAGSVGLPAYSDDKPHFHRMECGSPHARYARVQLAPDGTVEAEIVAATYDWEAAAATVRARGWSDWVQPLLTGRA